jgi:hypothetical protein
MLLFCDLLLLKFWTAYCNSVSAIFCIYIALFSLQGLKSCVSQSLLPVICVCFQPCTSWTLWLPVQFSFFYCCGYYWFHYSLLVILIPSPPSGSMYTHDNLGMIAWVLLNPAWQGQLSIPNINKPWKTAGHMNNRSHNIVTCIARQQTDKHLKTEYTHATTKLWMVFLVARQQSARRAASDVTIT